MSKLQDSRRALLEIIAIASDDIVRIDAAEHDVYQNEEVAEVV